MHGIPFSADYLYKSTERSSEEGKLKYPNMVQCGMVGVVQCTMSMVQTTVAALFASG